MIGKVYLKDDPEWQAELACWESKKRHRAALEACKHLEDEPEYPEEDRYAE